jgi:acetylornithine deacetylase
VRKLIADLARREVRPRACIVGEPTLMKPIGAHKGKLSTRCRVHGFECHSALAHHGVNAVEAAAEVVAYLKTMARRFRDNGPYDAEFNPPYTTVHTGKIQGGTALNIVPKDCSFDFEFRFLPSEDPLALLAEIRTFAETRLLPEMRTVHADTGFEWHELSAFAGLATGADEEIAQMVMQLTGANTLGKVSFGTEGGLFQQAGIPTMICGPGSIEQAHKPDEFIALDQIAQCEGMLTRLLDKLAA